MTKLLLAFFITSVTIFGSIQSITFECDYTNSAWGTFGTTYWCYVQNYVRILTINAAKVDGISGSHLPGYNNDNVEAFSVAKGQIRYFPSGLDKFFKNLKGILMVDSNLKEIHKSDLKPFSKLTNLYLYKNNLEILEDNLFEFNPNLEYVALYSNKISHIDANVFDKLVKLNSLIIQLNPCINLKAENNLMQLQNVIKAIKAQCINSDYSTLNQKAINLEIESTHLSLEKYKEKLKNLESEIKNSKFKNFFQDILQESRKAQEMKDKEEKFIQETVRKVSNIEDFLVSSKNCTARSNNTLTAYDEQFDKIRQVVESKISSLESKIIKMDQKITESDNKLDGLYEKVSKFSTDTTTTLKDIESSNTQNFAAIMNFIENLSKKMEAIEDKLTGIDSTQKKLMNKIHKIETDNQNRRVK